MEDAQNLEQLPLKDILDNQDLVLEEVLSIKGIHNKIKLSMPAFVLHCITHPTFTERFINIGLKCPMHESKNQQMKLFTYIAADILTCDHEALANLFILPQSAQRNGSNDEEIEEEIETEEHLASLQPPEKKYLFLMSIFDYLSSTELDENCINYITKTLGTLVRKKISQYLQFFIENPPFLQRLVDIAYFPSIAHLLSKMLTDDDDGLTDRAFSVKEKIIPLLLEKLHREIDRVETFDIFEGIEDLLSATRYADSEERTSLQKMSDAIVSEQQVSFFLTSFFSALDSNEKTAEGFTRLQNSVTYLALLLTRMNMDEQHDFTFNNEPQEFTPTLNYELEPLFLSFCRMITGFHRVWEFKEVVGKSFSTISIKVMEPLTLMSRHSKFSQFYRKINREDRSLALQALLQLLCTANLNGILLQSITTLLEKMMTVEEEIADTEIPMVCPDQLYLSISEYAGAIGGGITVLLEETRNQRNRNERGIYFRKILLLLDNFFRHASVVKQYPDTASLQKLFPAFNAHNNQLYAEKTIVLYHPGGDRSQPVEEFKFIEKNRAILRNRAPEQEAVYPQVEMEEASSGEWKNVKECKTKQMAFKLNSKIQTLKDRVKENKADKGQEDLQSARANVQDTIPNHQEDESLRDSPEKEQEKSPEKEQEKKSPKKEQERSPKKEQEKSPCKQKEPSGAPQPRSPCKQKEPMGLTFFIRHLMIY